MPVQNISRIINAVDAFVHSLQAKYKGKPDILSDLNRLDESCIGLNELVNAGQGLEKNQTEEISQYMNKMQLHLDILKASLEKEEYIKLNKGIKAISIIVKFHPAKYSFVTFVIAWFVEWMYLI